MQSSILLLITIVLSIFSLLQSSVDAVDSKTKSKDVCNISKLGREDGTQIKDGSCSVTVQGEIPNFNSMPSTVIIFPQDGSTIAANKPFTIRTKTDNLQTGFFSNATSEYYIFPQTLAGNGLIQGHSHVTVQKLGNDPTKTLDARVFAFFKGLNDPKDGKGELSVLVDNPGLPAGKYRLCTMVSSFTHQPVIMPVAQRGSQDDCVRFTAKNGGKKRGLKKRH